MILLTVEQISDQTGSRFDNRPCGRQLELLHRQLQTTQGPDLTLHFIGKRVLRGQMSQWTQATFFHIVSLRNHQSAEDDGHRTALEHGLLYAGFSGAQILKDSGDENHDFGVVVGEELEEVWD